MKCLVKIIRQTYQLYDFAIGLEDAKMENGIYRMYFPHSCVIYLRGKGRKDNLTLEIIMPDGQTLKYSLPAVYVEKYTRDTIFQKKLFLLLPFYIMRYEKSKKKLEQNSKQLQELLDEYSAIEKKLEENLLNQGKETQYRYLIEVIIRIADYIFADFENAKKGFGKVMGGKVLELKTDKLIKEIRVGVQKDMVIHLLKKGDRSLEEIADDTQTSLEQVQKIKEEEHL